MRISDWSSDVCSSDLTPTDPGGLFFSSGTTSLPKGILHAQRAFAIQWWRWPRVMSIEGAVRSWTGNGLFWSANITMIVGIALSTGGAEIGKHTSELQSLMRISYAVFCLKKKIYTTN